MSKRLAAGTGVRAISGKRLAAGRFGGTALPSRNLESLRADEEAIAAMVDVMRRANEDITEINADTLMCIRTIDAFLGKAG